MLLNLKYVFSHSRYYAWLRQSPLRRSLEGIYHLKYFIFILRFSWSWCKYINNNDANKFFCYSPSPFQFITTTPRYNPTQYYNFGRYLTTPADSVGRYNPARYDPSRYNPGRYDPGRYDPGKYDPGRYDPSRYDKSGRWIPDDSGKYK